MYIIKGLIRSTILYLGLVSAIREHSFQLLFLYLLILAANAVFCKLSKDHLSVGDSLFYAITHDILTPILGIRSLVELLLRKYLNSPNEHHAEVFLAQGIVEAIWGTMLTVYLAVIVFQML